MLLSNTKILAITAMLAFAGFLFALFSQHVLGMQPCAWCILQRMICLLIAAVAALGWLLAGARAKVASAIAALLAIAGIVAAWYQHTVAAKMFSCDMTLADRIVSTSGLDALLPSVFGIFATCAEAAVPLLGVKYELWSMLMFVVLGALNVYGLVRRAA